VRLTLLIVMVMVAAGFGTYKSIQKARAPLNSATATAAAGAINPGSKIDFDKQIKPILQSRCQPCHFQGGKVYERMPFDRPETIRTLGTKLFTRIKDEDERKIIREFLAQP
jgi:hypothetical protein